MTKTIGYLVMVGGAIALVVGAVLVVRSNPGAAILLGVGLVAGGAGYYIAKKQPALPGV